MSHARAKVKLGDRRVDTVESVKTGTTFSFGEPHGVFVHSCPLVIVIDEVTCLVRECSMVQRDCKRCRVAYVLNRVVPSLNPWCIVLSVVLVLRKCVREARLWVPLVLLSTLLSEGRMVAVVVLSSEDASTLVK